MERRPGLTRAHPSPASPADEHQDAARAASGDAPAYERLYRAHVARIHSLVRRMLGPDEAEEVTQDVFVRAWQRIGTFRGEAAFGTWLHRLAVNVVLTRRATLGTRRARFIEDDGVLDGLASPHGAAPGAGGMGLDLERALPRLPEGARQIFVLHDVEGYRHEEIARLMGVTTGTSKSQLHRARMLLRQRLEG